jgi:hypothetical protein
MSLLSFPDINVWLALLIDEHIHRPAALAWWRADRSQQVGFSRLTQIGVLRSLTTSAAMNGQPLSMAEAWSAYDYLYLDDRVVFLAEPPMLEQAFRGAASNAQVSPKLWADAYITAFAEVSGAQVVTFDQALAGRCEGSRLLLA